MRPRAWTPGEQSIEDIFCEYAGPTYHSDRNAPGILFRGVDTDRGAAIASSNLVLHSAGENEHSPGSLAVDRLEILSYEWFLHSFKKFHELYNFFYKFSSTRLSEGDATTGGRFQCNAPHYISLGLAQFLLQGEYNRTNQ